MEFLPHTVLDNGSKKYDLGSDLYIIEPKGYKPEIYSNFFKIENNPVDTYHQLVVKNTDPVELEGVKSISDLLLYSVMNKVEIIKIKINLKYLLGENILCITKNVMNNFLYMEELDSDVNISGLDTHITPDEIVPISYKAIGFCDFRIKNTDQMVTVYWSSKMPQNMNCIETLGRFKYGDGMLMLM